MGHPCRDRGAVGGFAVEHAVEAGRPLGLQVERTVGRVLQLEAGRVEEQPGRVDAAVLVVAHDRHAEGGGVDPHLVRAAGVGVRLVPLEPATDGSAVEVGPRLAAAASSRRADRLVAAQVVGAAVVSGDQQLVVLGDRAVLELLGQRPVGTRALAEDEEARRRLVEPVQRRQRRVGSLALHPLVHAVLGVGVGSVGVDACRLGHDEQVLVLEPDPRFSHRRSLGTHRPASGSAPVRRSCAGRRWISERRTDHRVRWLASPEGCRRRPTAWTVTGW